jgi:hypothetical protein
MEIKRKTRAIRTWKEHLFLDTIALPVCRNPKYRSLFDCCLSHFRTSVLTFSSAKRLPTSCEPLYVTNTSHRKQETFLYEYPLY